MQLIVEFDASAMEYYLQGYRQALGAPAISAVLQNRVDPLLRGWAQEAFDTETDPTGRKWTPLKNVTNVNFRIPMGFPPAHPINERTGELREAYTQEGEIVVIPGDDTDVVLQNPTARIKNGDPELQNKMAVAAGGRGRGTTPKGKARKPVPARPIVGLTASRADQITMVFAVYIAEITNGLTMAAAIEGDVDL